MNPRVRRLLADHYVWLLFGATIIIGFAAHPRFLLAENLRNIVVQSATLGLASLGQAFVILLGGIDLSIGSMISLLTTAMAGLFQLGIPTPLVVTFILLLGAALGAINGFIVVRMGVTPLVATLGTMAIFQGAVLLYSSRTIGGVPHSFTAFMYDPALLGLPAGVLVSVLLFAVAWILVDWHRLGQYIYATGADEHVARISGVSVDLIKYLAYTLTGVFAALASAFMVSRMGSGGPRVGQGMELDTITAVVIAGISLSGGKGRITSVLGGVVILMMINNILNLTDVASETQILFKGLLLITIVSIYRLSPAAGWRRLRVRLLRASPVDADC